MCLGAERLQLASHSGGFTAKFRAKDKAVANRTLVTATRLAVKAAQQRVLQEAL
jgi:hypothetical protein